ncbi:hypothetical protein E4U13_002355 [Claviceps humidiphila]|uniref:N-acetyltransferase domain-containing protein n=1 Tax=Claviceps humidiphila TaxID=1294629 RepID=A0A9P7Q9L6_9HYPO|nr:hypothetical protein E4U13_002355 [Claviceps humidiphila]
MASPTAKKLPVRNPENFSKVCKEMKSWIQHVSHAPETTTSLESLHPKSTAAGFEPAKDSSESLEQEVANAGRPASLTEEAGKADNGKTCLPELHGGPETELTERPPASEKVCIEPASTASSQTSQLSATVDISKYSPNSVSITLSAVKGSSPRPSEKAKHIPLGLIGAAAINPVGRETRACLGDKECGGDCSSHCGNGSSMAFPNFSDRSVAGISNCVSDEAACENWQRVAKVPHDDPVKSWFAKYMTSPSLLVSSDEISNAANSRCDINPDTGHFLTPACQPETLRCVTVGPCEGHQDILWRQMNMTSELYIMKERRSRENMVNSIQMAIDHGTGYLRSMSKSDQALARADCTVRPATQMDFAVVAEVVNANKASGEAYDCAMRPQDDKSFAMRSEDIARIWEACRAEKRPFIVVEPAEEDLLDRSKWPNHSEIVYEEFARFVAEHPRPCLGVVGFAFVTGSQPGLSDRVRPEACFSGRLTLMVHPDHRHKLYGSALLDRIMTTIMPLYNSVVDHEWNCDEMELNGTRQYTRLHVELTEANDGDDTPGRTHFLKKFGFEEVGRLKDVVATEDGQRNMHWRDLVTWARAITPGSKISVRRSV